MAISVPSDQVAMLQNAAKQIGMPYAVVVAQVNDESGFNPRAVSPANAEGEFQFLPSTYTGLGFPAGTEFDPTEEVKAYVAYMRQLLSWSHGNVRQALAGYNAGQGNWQAGLGYADSILSAAGQGITLTSNPGTGGTASNGAVPGAPGTSGSGSGNAPSLFVPIITPLEHVPWLGPMISGFFGGSANVVGGAIQAGATIGDVATAIGGIVDDISKFMKWLSWLFVPAHWLRVGAFIVGIASLGGGIYMFRNAL